MDKIIKEYISKAPDGFIFSIKDLLDIAPYDTIKNTLQRMEKKGEISRVINGIYSKPKFSTFLNEYVPVSIYQVAQKIAEKFGWSIIPSGVHALNILHLSTQVPAHYVYLSDGPYREYEIQGIKLKFKHTSTRYICGMSPISSLVIQAFRCLGQEHVTKNTLNTLKLVLREEDKIKLIDECKKAPVWIYEYIKILALSV